MTVAPFDIKGVAIIDDNEQAATATRLLIEEAGFEPAMMDQGFKDTAELVTAVEHVGAAICDHRLTLGGYAPFDGATAVATLFEAKIPGVLVTQFPMDFDVSIRRWRHHIPVLLSRDEADAKALVEGLMVAWDEMGGLYVPERKPWRSIVRVEGIKDEDNRQVIDAIVPAWNPVRAVRFPAALLPPELTQDLHPGLRFLARVNIRSPRDQDLYLCDFEIAPEPEADDGLG